MEPAPQPERPTPAEAAAALLASIDFRSPASKMKSESEIVTAAYRQKAERDLAHLEPVELAPRAAASFRERFAGLVDEWLVEAANDECNRGVDLCARLITELSVRPGAHGLPEVHGLVEIRARNGQSVAWVKPRLVPLEDGVVMMRVRSRERLTDLNRVALISPRGFSSEVEKLRTIAAAAAASPEKRPEFEQSFLYALIRSSLAERHGFAGSWQRDLKRVIVQGTAEEPRFTLFFTPRVQFDVRIRYDPDICRIAIESRGIARH